ncbi:MAG TPA: alpha/beta hydrolase-fold protein, partial [Acidothermaceae bacterium]|nr:alpha/beta hydrolase-fold protein [Acidothermaceae bacterium]
VPASIAIPRLPLAATATKGRGRVVELALAGAQSGISRKGFGYLPPQYFQPAYAQTRFPVLELLHGDPGAPTGWVYALNVPGLMDHEINAGKIGPMIIVMPATFSGSHGQDCLDAPSGQLDGTYLATDVPGDIVRDFRALPQGPNWAIGGLSDGGFCATNLALQHRGSYGAVASLDGFYSAYSDLTVMDKVFGAGSPSITANDPSTLVLDVHQSLPRFWIMSGSGNATDTKAAQYFRQLVTTREPIQYVVVNHGNHTPPAWRVALPALLGWVWQTMSGGTVATGTTHLGVPVQPSTGPSPPMSPPAVTQSPTAVPPTSARA